MNANELANLQAFKTEELTMWERNTTATMLRKLQADKETMRKDYMILAGKYQDALLELKFGKAQEK